MQHPYRDRLSDVARDHTSQSFNETTQNQTNINFNDAANALWYEQTVLIDRWKHKNHTYTEEVEVDTPIHYWGVIQATRLIS